MKIKSKKKGFSWEQWHWIALFLIVIDLIIISVSYFFALWVRFDCQYTTIPEYYRFAWLKFVPIYALATLAVMMCLRLYRSVWKYAGIVELKKLMLASAILGVFHTVGITLLFQRMPISYYVIGMIVQFMLMATVRFLYRFLNIEKQKKLIAQNGGAAYRVMLIGAGSAGQMILRDLHNETNERVCCIIDDDPKKSGRYIDGVPIVGGRDDILSYAEKYKIDKIYLTIPSLTAEQRRDILDICKETKCELKVLPAIHELVTNNVTVRQMKKVVMEDLLGRPPIRVNMDEIFDFIAGKVVLVTGGGGSIGSELCRQIAQHAPKQLIIFDIYENNAHAIGLELKDKYPELNLEVLIGSVRDTCRLEQVFAKFKPQLVYHAAAHKHVPLMEDSPCESIKNNAVGTYKTAYAAMMNGCERFVLISTDKAVNPTNVMGASKRLCEMIIQSFDKKIRAGRASEIEPICFHAECHGECEGGGARLPDSVNTRFVAVRFGNVLGSNGSVIPRFKEQIERGGPVTVTHPDIVRYFMTIPEAVSLVLQAGVYADGGEIFVLDMGEPVKIDTLARNLIKLSGLKPDVDIKISYIGLRPGEKLYEEKFMIEEGMKTTPNKLIHILSPIELDEEQFFAQLRGLMDVAYSGDEKEIRRLIADAVTTYHAAE